MANWNDILSGNGEEINDEELLKYLEGNLPENQKQIIEQKLQASEFSNDALEGLEQFSSKKNLDVYVDQLNRNLHQQLVSRKSKLEKRKPKDQQWILITIIIVLAICIIGYALIHFHIINQSKTSTTTVIQNSSTAVRR